MKQDCTVSLTTADETKSFQTSENAGFPEGTCVSEPDKQTGSEVEKCTGAKTETGIKATEIQDLSLSLDEEENNPEQAQEQAERYHPVAWCYLFIHHTKVKSCEELLERDGLTYFIHKTIKYVPRHRGRGGLREIEKPTVSGLVFIQGKPNEIQKYLNENMPAHRLRKNCSTGKVATIPCNQMEPFMRVAETEPDRLRFLLRPFVYYSKNRTLLRIVTGDYTGLEGYVIRIARDRKLVMDVGGMAIALSGIHAERFEEVHKNEADRKECEVFYKRNLHERNAFIDRYFHQVKTAQEVAAQVENIEILRLQTLADVRDKKLDLKDAYTTFYFMIEEIGYYYAPFIDHFKDNLAPIFEAGKTVMEEIEKTIKIFSTSDKELHNRCETEFESLQNSYGYLFEWPALTSIFKRNTNLTNLTNLTNKHALSGRQYRAKRE